MKSLSEIETVSKRSSKAAGFSWGVAEEAGKNIRILEMFGLPGIGKLVLEAIDNRDAMLLQGAVTMIALAYVAINLIVDLLYGLIDPRVGEGGQGIDG